jgi:aminocarboxymuconate-semialdehyde decarboxylase
MMGVTITPLFYLYWIEADINVTYAKIQNDALANFCRGREDRLFFIPTLPLQDIKESVREVDRSIGELGGKAINIGGSGIDGHEVGDEHFWPVYERLVHYDIPLVIHPYPTDQVAKAQGTSDNTPDPYQIHPILEYIFQETVAVHTLLFSGALDEFPDLKIYVPHGGGFIPYQFGRIEAFAPVSGSKAKRPLRSYLPNFYFDTLIHDLQSRQHLVDWMGADNILVGDNFEGIDSADGFALTDELSLSDGDKEKIKSLNAKRLFKV